MQYGIVSGGERSGTSAMMLALKQSGIPIIGFKFPITIKRKDGVTLDVGLWDGWDKAYNQIHDNPLGFWEIASITAKGLQKEHLRIGFDGDVAKVISSMLPVSDPSLVGKVVIMVRDPLRALPSRAKNLGFTSLDMFRLTALIRIHNELRAIEWLAKHGKEFRIVIYEELLNRPKKIVKGICKFFGRGDYKYGAKMIDRKLNKTEPITLKAKEIDEAVDFYKLCVNNDIKSILKINLKDLEVRILELNKLNNNPLGLKERQKNGKEKNS